MRLLSQRAIAAILAGFLLVSLTACQNLPPPSRTPPAGTIDTTPPGSESAPATPPPAEPSEEPGEAPAESPEPEPKEVLNLLIDPARAEITKGSRIDPYVFIIPSDATDRSYTLSSGDESVLRELGGRWTAVGPGTTELTATATNGVTGTMKVTVIVPVEGITLGVDEISLNRGDRATLTVTISPYDATDQNVRYRSSDERVVKVSGDGTVEAVGAGTAQIHFSVGDVRESLAVTVTAPVTAISIRTDRRDYRVGDKGYFSVQIVPEDSSDKTNTVSFSGDRITLTGDNSFSCDSAGEVTLTATASNGITGSQTIAIIDLASFADEVFRLTNVERINAGLPVLNTRSELTLVADVRANEIIRHFSHDRPDGREFFTVFQDENVSYYAAGENLAAGQRTPAEVVRGWMDSPDHRENILRSEFGCLGVAVTMDNNGRLYWTQLFSN